MKWPVSDPDVIPYGLLIRKRVSTCLQPESAIVPAAKIKGEALPVPIETHFRYLLQHPGPAMVKIRDSNKRPKSLPCSPHPNPRAANLRPPADYCWYTPGGTIHFGDLAPGRYTLPLLVDYAHPEYESTGYGPPAHMVDTTTKVLDWHESWLTKVIEKNPEPVGITLENEARKALLELPKIREALQAGDAERAAWHTFVMMESKAVIYELRYERALRIGLDKQRQAAASGGRHAKATPEAVARWQKKAVRLRDANPNLSKKAIAEKIATEESPTKKSADSSGISPNTIRTHLK